MFMFICMAFNSLLHNMFILNAKYDHAFIHACVRYSDFYFQKFDRKFDKTYNWYQWLLFL